jgi:hypothetical protein
MRGAGGRPVREFLGDRPLVINFILWGLVVLFILYAGAGR